VYFTGALFQNLLERCSFLFSAAISHKPPDTAEDSVPKFYTARGRGGGKEAGAAKILIINWKSSGDGVIIPILRF
jgi:hypothetical protein